MSHTVGKIRIVETTDRDDLILSIVRGPSHRAYDNPIRGLITAVSELLPRMTGCAFNPIRFALLLSLVLIESLALYTLVIIFVKVV